MLTYRWSYVITQGSCSVTEWDKAQQERTLSDSPDAKSVTYRLAVQAAEPAALKCYFIGCCNNFPSDLELL